MRRAAAVVVVVAVAGCGESVLEVLAPSGPAPADAGADVADGAPLPDAQDDTGACPGKLARDLPCASSDQCCSGYCTLGPTVEYTCRPTTGCVGLGGACTHAGACCSLGCTGAADQPAMCSSSTCAPGGSTCTRDTECCSNKCTGTCQSVGAGCRPAGDSCVQASDCCGRVCTGDGPLTCALLQGCRAEGETCDAAGDCCSGRCAADPSTSVLRCTSVAACTMNDKKPCSRQVGDVCKDATECCSRLCVATSDGTSRCAPAGGCRAECETCGVAGDCCSGACAADANGTMRCQAAMCGALGEICGADGDCCPGTKCVQDPPMSTGPKRCKKMPAPPCAVAGASCAVASDCCAGARCVPGSSGAGVCSTMLVPLGGACSARADCAGASGAVDCLELGGARVCAELVR